MHVVETSLNLLAHASLPLKFWDYDFLAATYLINRMHTSVLGMDSPYKVLYNTDPDYKFLKNFGFACYPHLRPYNSNKFAYHSKECLFLGYSNQHKWYTCLAADGRLFISKDVIFNDTKFLY